MVDWKYLWCSIAAGVLLCMFTNPTAVSWLNLADFSGPPYKAYISGITGAAIGVPLLFFLSIGGFFVLKNFGRTTGFIFIVGGLIFAAIMSVESKGAAVLSNSTLVFFIGIIGTAIAIGAALSVSEAKPKK